MRNKITEELRSCLSAFKSIGLLVISDEYPPDIVGGAEISLHETLRASELASRTLVVKFSSSENCVTFYRYQGIQVLALPNSGIWQVPGDRTFTKLRKFMGSKWGKLWILGRIVQILWRYGLTSERLAAFKIWISKPKPSGGMLVDSLPERYELSAVWLNEITKELQPNNVVASNARSIVLKHYAAKAAPQIWAATNSIAMVRDNRFFCSRHNQIVRVKDRDCITCDYSCAILDNKSKYRAQTTLLRATQKIRETALNDFDKIMVTSQFLKNQLKKSVTDSDHISIVPNFAGNPETITSIIKDVKKSSSGEILIIGSINEAKGQLEFLEASINQLKKFDDNIIHVVGKGDRHKSNILNMLKKHKVENKVKFTGFLSREKLYEAIKKAKIVVSPTLWPEPFGRVPLECGLCKTPIVSFVSGGLVETIIDKQTGFLIPKGNYESMWEKILLLIDNEELRTNIGEAAFQHVSKNYRMENTTSLFEALLSKKL